MGILAQRLAVDPFADSYYTSQPSAWTAAGVNVGGDAAMRISTVFACRRILAETVGSLPCVTYRRLPNDGKERATDHPLYDLLHDEPNNDQTATEWFETMTGWAAIRGNARSEKVGPGAGMIDELIPIHPDNIKVERVRGTFGSDIRYEITEPNGSRRRVLRDDIFQVRGFSDDGITGLAIGDLARDSFGVALSAELHASRTFGTAPRPAAVLEMPPGDLLSEEAFKRLQSQLAGHSGPHGSQRTLILEGGAKLNAYGMSNVDAEFLATRQFSVTEICRWFRIPPHMVADLTKSAFSNIEMQSLEFVIYTMLPWFRRWEQAIRRDLILATGTYFAEFLISGLLRGDTKDRYEAYAVGRQWGWLSVNDIRRLENLNPVVGGDTYLSPLNMAPVGGDRGATAFAALDGETGKLIRIEPGSSGGKLVSLLAGDAASRVVRKELAAMRKLADRTAGAEWETGVRAFYADHPAHVARECRMDLAEATAWSDARRDELLADGPSVLEGWDAAGSEALTMIALRGEEIAA